MIDYGCDYQAIFMSHPLVVRGLSKIFSQRSRWLLRPVRVTRAVNDISFFMREGEFLGFLGPNGAGKTTTIQMLLDLLTPTSGEIIYFDQNLATNKNVRQYIAYASGYMRLPSSLTVRQALAMYGMLYGMSRAHIKQKSDELIHTLRLERLCDQKTSTLSAGQTTIVLVARAFLVEPKIVLLDEPTAALDPENADIVRKFIAQKNKQSGVGILFTSHNMAEVADLCDRILVIKEGVIVADNTPEKLAATVRSSRVQLMLTSAPELWHTFVQQEKLQYKHDGHYVEIVVDEHAIAHLLMRLARAGIEYSQIAVEKPTLEDYFLLMARKGEL